MATLSAFPLVFMFLINLHMLFYILFVSELKKLLHYLLFDQLDLGTVPLCCCRTFH